MCVLAALAGCAQLVGADFDVRVDEAGSGAAGGSGGASTATTGGAGPSTATGGGGQGGDPGPCDLYALGSCGPGLKCSVTDEAIGVDSASCVEAGPRAPWTKCLQDAECAEGLWCDALTEVCKPVCASGNSCSSGAQCLQAMSGASPIPGLKLCTAHCNPFTAQPCASDWGKTTCFYDVGAAEFDCSSTAGYGEGAGCTAIDDCDVGLVCVGDTCKSWCTPPGGTSTCLSFCVATNPATQYEGMELGVCDP